GGADRRRCFPGRGGMRVPPLAKRTLGLPVAATIERALRRTELRCGLAVMYHRVGDPAGDPSRELVPSLGRQLFESQLRYLGRRYRVVRASELLEAGLARGRG